MKSKEIIKISSDTSSPKKKKQKSGFKLAKLSFILQFYSKLRKR